MLAQRGLYGGIGLSAGGGKGGERKITELMASLAEKGVDIRGLIARANNPIRFIPPHGGNPADGYEATILPDICAVLIEAQQLGKLGRPLTRICAPAPSASPNQASLPGGPIDPSAYLRRLKGTTFPVGFGARAGGGSGSGVSGSMP